MFTGLVETIGTVSSLIHHDDTEGGGSGTSLTITDCASVLNDVKLGDSISINGTCLTITSLHPPSPSPPTSFKVGLSPETLLRTSLSSLRTSSSSTPSSRVNLERSVQPSTRMGGHFVQGHVDTIATITSKTPDGNSVRYRFTPRDKGVLRYIVEKGYVCLDGASLTITGVGGGGEGEGEGEEEGEGWFEVMLIAYTQEKIVMGKKEVGEVVNVEVDMVGKYVEKSVQGCFEGAGGGWLEGIIGKIVERRMAEVGK